MTSMGAAPEASTTPTVPGQATEAAATILIVDDDEGLRMLFDRYITAFGYRPLLASDGEEALSVAAVTPEIRLIILDLVMAGISGRALAEQLMAALPGAAILVCSGHPESALVRLGLDVEGTHFMQKPCRPAELQKRLREMLAAR